MKPNFIVFAATFAVLGCVAGVWMTSSISLAAPLVEPRVSQDPEPIVGGTQDVANFFSSQSYNGKFELLKASRDETLVRRYYHVKVPADQVQALRRQIVTNWTLGRFNRAIYENGVSGKLRKSVNMPKWWNFGEKFDADNIMLDHGGSPNWYIVLSSAGDVCLMWCGH